MVKQKDEEALKKIHIKNMMKRNREQSKLDKEKEISLDQSLNHLINPVEFQMMDQKGALKKIAERENKKRVDKINIIRSKNNRKSEKDRVRKES